MLKVLFFGQTRDVLQESELRVQGSFDSVADLRIQLQQRGELWQEYLAVERTLVAINQSMGNDQTSLKSGDEVAFFPPVTGG